MISGSVTSIGVAYPRQLEPGDLARYLAALLGPILQPRSPGRWPVQFVGGGQREVHVETAVKEEAEAETTLRLLEQLLTADCGELEAEVDLPGLGRVEVVLRPETALCGMLIDLPDSALFPEQSLERSEIVTNAIHELLLGWYDVSRFAVAFADHEAEFDVDPLELGPTGSPYALLALPAKKPDGSPLDFHRGGWSLSPLGA